MSALRLTARQLAEACAQWECGCPFFGDWAVKHIEHMTVGQYGELVKRVRAELRDDTDYSQESSDDDSTVCS